MSWVVQLALPRRTRKAWTRRSLHSPPALRMSSSGEPEMIARPLPALWLLEVPVFASTWRTGSEPRSAAQTKAGLPAPAGLAPAPHQFRDSGGRAAEQGEASRSSPLAIQSSPFRWPGRGAPAERPMRSCGRRAWRASDRAIASARAVRPARSSSWRCDRRSRHWMTIRLSSKRGCLAACGPPREGGGLRAQRRPVRPARRRLNFAAKATDRGIRGNSYGPRAGSASW